MHEQLNNLILVYILILFIKVLNVSSIIKYFLNKLSIIQFLLLLIQEPNNLIHDLMVLVMN